MARFLFMTGPYPGHLAPLIPIVRTLIKRGHEILWITGREYSEKVKTVGARFHPLPKEGDPNGMEIYDFYPKLKEKKGIAQMKYWVKHIFLDACTCDMRTIETVLKDFPADVLVGDTVTFAPFFMSEISGLPSAQISLLPLCLLSRDTAPFGLGLLPGKNLITKTRNRLLNFLTNYFLLRDIDKYANDTRLKLGLKPLNGLFFRAMYKIPSLTLHISTQYLEYPRSDQPDNLRFIGPIIPEPNLHYEPPRWWTDLNGSEPVVLVNQGTIAKDLNDLIVPAIEGLKNEKILVIAVPVKEGQLPKLPANVRAESFIPFDHLLPHVDVMITNGGYGGTQWALAKGIPLVVSGETEDKREVAARVEWAGAGINLRKKRPSPDQIRKAVKEVLTNSVYRNNAMRIQADFAKYDAPAGAADLLEALPCCKLPLRVLQK